MVNEPYIFTPESNFDVLPAYSGFSPDVITTGGYTIENKPDWLTFDPVTGVLSGTPSANDVGVYDNIKITGTSQADGCSAEMDPFQIVVTPEINQSPTFHAGADQTVCKNPGDIYVVNWATGIDDGDFNTQGIKFITTSNSNPDLFGGLLHFGGQPWVDEHGALSFRPALNASGSAHVCLVLKDDGGTVGGGQDTSSEQCFNITVDPSCDDGAGEIFNPGQFDFGFFSGNTGNA